MAKRRKSQDPFGDFLGNFDDFEEQVKIISQCPVCDAKFNSRQSQIVGDSGDANLVYISCKKCLNSVLVVIRFDPFGISSVGMVTDLTYDDVLRISEAEAVDADDVLDVYTELKQNTLINKLKQRL